MNVPETVNKIRRRMGYQTYYGLDFAFSAMDNLSEDELTELDRLLNKVTAGMTNREKVEAA